MEWPERMNAVIDYIEDNLIDEVDIEKAADIACCSTYHLQRIFLAVNGLSIAEYIRRRRLTLAAGEIMTGNARIIDIALKYGYTSPDSFTRAFRNLHGVNPQAARESGVELVAFPRIRFHITLTGGVDMEYKIVEKPAFEIIAKTERTISDKIINGVILPETWEKFWWDVWDAFNREKRYEEFRKLTGGRPGQVTGAEFLGITTLSDNMEEFSYAIGFENNGIDVPEGYDIIRIPAAAWAVFESKGAVPKAIHDLEDRVFIEWFPSTGYEHDNKPELEIYLTGDRSSEEYRCQFWEPVVKKDR